MFLDVLMPDMGGVQVLQELQSISHRRDIPVIIHSSKALDAKEEQVIREQTSASFPSVR